MADSVDVIVRLADLRDSTDLHNTAFSGFIALVCNLAIDEIGRLRAENRTLRDDIPDPSELGHR